MSTTDDHIIMVAGFNVARTVRISAASSRPPSPRRSRSPTSTRTARRDRGPHGVPRAALAAAPPQRSHQGERKGPRLARSGPATRGSGARAARPRATGGAPGLRQARAIVVTPDEEVAAPAPSVAVVDTIGAGNAFGGGFVSWGRRRGRGPGTSTASRRCARRQTSRTVAARTCEQPGPRHRIPQSWGMNAVAVLAPRRRGGDVP